MIIDMSKVEIIGPKKHFYETISLLHRLGCLHIEDISKAPAEDTSFLRPMSVDEQLEAKRVVAEQLLTRLNGLIVLALGSDIAKYERSRDTDRLYRAYCEKDFEELRDIATEIVREVEERPQQVAREKEKLEEQYAMYQRYKTIIGKVKPLVESAIKLEGFESVAILVDRKYQAVLPLIEEELRRTTRSRFEILQAEVDKDTIAALLIFPREFSEAVHAFLWAENVTQVTLPDELAHMTYMEALAYMEEQIRSLPRKIASLGEEMKSYSSKYGSQLIALRDALMDRWKELQVVTSFGETSYTFVIRGWIPKKRVKKVAKELQKAFGGVVTLAEIPVSHEEMEQAPVVLENPSWARPFELILGFFSLPKYGTIDPTPFIAIFYPLFFGIIIGDVGYGAVLLALCALAAWKWRESRAVRAAAYMVGFCAIMAIVFGFVYNEFFGYPFWERIGLHEFQLFGLHFPYERAYEKQDFIRSYLLFALGLGVGQIFVGLVLGIINTIRERATRHLVEKIGYMLLLFGSLSIAGAIFRKLPASLQDVGIIAVLVSLVLIVWGGGIVGAIHILTMFGHLASYLRIMALGIAGVVLAFVARELSASVSSVALGILIALLVHSLNLVMHTFSSTIHSIRLNVLEFFDKFYEGGGTPYEPFALQRR